MKKSINLLAERVLKIVHEYDKTLKVELKKSEVYLMDVPSKSKTRYLIKITKI